MTLKGAIAAGHEETARAAAIILEEGGNAFDAALAGMLAACITEPVLASLGGGGFLLAHAPDNDGAKSRLYDFFVQTPKTRLEAATADFFPIVADFGDAQQEFHIGRGSIATPGMVKGLFKVHADLGRMPMKRIIEPAAALARDGVTLNRLQAYIFSVVDTIYMSNETCRGVYGSEKSPGIPLIEGEVFRIPDFADAIDALAREGDDLFYRGDIAGRMVEDCRTSGGTLTRADLESYAVKIRPPLEMEYGGVRILTNPPPSTGGILIAFALELLRGENLREAGFGSAEHLTKLAESMRQTNKARLDSALHDRSDDAAEHFLNPDFVRIYREGVQGRPQALRGTTHISVIDAAGNAAAVTMSNGEGSGYLIPGTAIMLNNMLGEEDINPTGFHQWQADQRMCSMMAPTLLAGADGERVVLGSGGSNRIRTAILQVILNLVEFALPVEEAVSNPRIHFEGGLLSIEPGYEREPLAALTTRFPEYKEWSDRNLFFGGVQVVRAPALERAGSGELEGTGDPRRGGAVRLV